MNENHLNIIHSLQPNVYISAKELASQFDVSIKTDVFAIVWGLLQTGNVISALSKTFAIQKKF